MYIPLAWLFLAYLWRLASANVEKTIFLAPSFSPLPSDTGLDDLGLERLSPLTPVLRTYLNASFPTDDAPLGAESWYFLDNLTPGKRYEVRICYLATVRMHTYIHLPYQITNKLIQSIATHLIQSLNAHSSGHNGGCGTILLNQPLLIL